MRPKSILEEIILYLSLVTIISLGMMGCAFEGPDGDFGPHFDGENESILGGQDDAIHELDQRLVVESNLLHLAMADYDDGEDDDIDEDCEEEDDCEDEDDEGRCEVAEHCEAVREASFCSETLETITCPAGSECFCPSGSWCLLECPDGGCTFRWGEGSCATLDCPSCDCNAVPPPPGGAPSAATTCFWSSAY